MDSFNQSQNTSLATMDLSEMCSKFEQVNLETIQELPLLYFCENHDSGLGDELDSHSAERGNQTNRNNLSDEQIQNLFGGDEDGDNLLHISVIHGDEAIVYNIIQTAPDFTYLNVYNNDRRCALHYAVITGNCQVTRRLVCAGAAVDAQDMYGNTPLHLASVLGNYEIVQQLVKPVEYEETLLNHYPIPFQRIPQDMNVRNYDGYNCLHLAIVHNHIDVVRLLLDTGLDIHYGHGKNGRSALHLASERGNVEMLTLLIERTEVVVDVQDFDGLTSFQLALGRGNEQVKRILIRNGATFKTLDFDEDQDIDLSAVN